MPGVRLQDAWRLGPITYEENLMMRLPTIFTVLCAVAVSLMVADTASAAGRGRRGQSCDCAPACAAEPACGAAEPGCAAGEPCCGAAAAEPACGAAEPACGAEAACCGSAPTHRRARRGLFSGRRAHHGGSTSGCASCCEEPACSAEPCCNAG